MLWITGLLELAFVHEQRGIDRVEIGENRLPELVLEPSACGKAEDGSG
jgi:hypothetical protein